MLSAEEFFTRCAGSVDQYNSTESFIGYFQSFRPNGSGLNELFKGAVKGKEVLERLLAIYKAIESSYCKNDWYFLVKKPPTVSETKACSIFREHLQSMKLIVDEMDEMDVSEEISNITHLNVLQLDDQSINYDVYESSLEAGIQDIVTDLLCEYDPIDSEALLLEEGIYSMTMTY
ncbi:hypothetical protein [Spartinivicinus poritis]|uniref:Uncharacterized protein n=1 Tax=Spartinivicinus poritis TaxID=2994640 RepID=A0ABT5UF56_9GAMM|nr:hypothetical protein [Spartinivicinus sp. A2-2]MDE1464142.1 hypothetical protein [Spartinivicinus sp. A2-2]